MSTRKERKTSMLDMISQRIFTLDNVEHKEKLKGSVADSCVQFLGRDPICSS